MLYMLCYGSYQFWLQIILYGFHIFLRGVRVDETRHQKSNELDILYECTHIRNLWIVWCVQYVEYSGKWLATAAPKGFAPCYNIIYTAHLITNYIKVTILPTVDQFNFFHSIKPCKFCDSFHKFHSHFFFWFP